MLRTLDALGLTHNLNEDASKVETTPYSNVLGRTAIFGAFLPAKGATILVLLIRPRLYPEVLHTSSSGIIFSGLDHCVLDIQQILEYPERTVNKPSFHQSSFHKDESEGTYDWILDEFACPPLRLCAWSNRP